MSMDAGGVLVRFIACDAFFLAWAALLPCSPGSCLLATMMYVTVIRRAFESPKPFC